MVVQYGMSDTLGPLSYAPDGRPLLPSGWQPPRPFSERTARRIDAEVERLLRAAHKRVTLLLQKDHGSLETLAQALIAKEVLEGAELEELLGLAIRRTSDENQPTHVLEGSDGGGSPGVLPAQTPF